MRFPTVRMPSAPAMPVVHIESRKIATPLRVAQGIVAVITLGTTTYVSNWWRNYWHDSPPAEINYLIFSSVFTIFALAYLTVVPARFSRYAPPTVVLGVEGLSMTFWFAGFVALAVFLAARVCFGNVCNIARVAAAFAAIQWLLFAASTIIAGMQVMKAKQGPGLPPAKTMDDSV